MSCPCTIKLQAQAKKLKRDRNTMYKDILKFHNNRRQFVCVCVCVLSKAGGTRKSKVFHSVKKYCKRLCVNLDIDFNRRTIVVTALNETADVSINGETKSK